MTAAIHPAPAAENQKIRLYCTHCGSRWWSRSAAAVALYREQLERAGDIPLFKIVPRV